MEHNDMTKWKFNSVFSTVLVVAAALGLQGCWEENEPNNDPEEAYWSGQHVQLWSGDWNWPNEGTLPFPNGTGTVSASDSVDNWPVSMWNWVTGEEASGVLYFEGTLWLSQSADVSIGWNTWLGGDHEDAIWEAVQVRQNFNAPKNVVISVYEFSLHVDDVDTLYSLEISGNGTYGFMLNPVYN